MALPAFNMRQLLEAGVHFGHQSHRWNPKMAPFIFGARNNIHIIDLAQTVPLLHQALVKVSDVVAGGGRVLFVGTKRQASEAHRRRRQALGPVLHQPPLARRHADQLEDHLAVDPPPAPARRNARRRGHRAAPRRRCCTLTRERDKLNRSLGGIKDMGGLPDLLFVIDTNKEEIAIAEARKLGIPIVAIVDTNCDPDGIDFPVPGNDDAGRAITLYCDLVARAAIDGIERGQARAGVDVGAAESAAGGGAAARPRRPPSRASTRRAAKPTISSASPASTPSSSSASTTPASTTSGRSPISTPRTSRRSTAPLKLKGRIAQRRLGRRSQEAGRRRGGLMRQSRRGE